jgi:hypothetical protein
MASTFNKGMRPSSRHNAGNVADQKTINRMTTTRRLKRVKVGMPEFNCLKDEIPGPGCGPLEGAAENHGRKDTGPCRPPRSPK